MSLFDILIYNYKGIKYSLNDTPNFKDKKLSGRLFSFAIGNEEYLKVFSKKSNSSRSVGWMNWITKM